MESLYTALYQKPKQLNENRKEKLKSQKEESSQILITWSIMFFIVLFLLISVSYSANYTITDYKDLNHKVTKFYGAQRSGDVSNWLVDQYSGFVGMSKT